MRFGVVRFPGTCDEIDALRACAAVGDAQLLWHGDADLKGSDVIVIPGGFSYGDYLRVGALARLSPVMGEVAKFAAAGGPVLGICNGFQILAEAGLVPGALLPNLSLRFVCREVDLVVATARTPFTSTSSVGDVLRIPAKHKSGRFYVPDAQLPELVANDQVLFRYADGQNPNGSLDDIAGVCNLAGNVAGLMPHPEHAVDALIGSIDGLRLFEGAAASAAPAAA
ncbi:MAG: phosphoribosylformylglycinamidine synthase subunit PurQ [Solirubrobacteraceae bacterium]|nr:phosphoribosylformylglycinamidine synthase subunit PurQ [Solirubrobacteraceae bacterium]